MLTGVKRHVTFDWLVLLGLTYYYGRITSHSTCKIYYTEIVIRVAQTLRSLSMAEADLKERKALANSDQEMWNKVSSLQVSLSLSILYTAMRYRVRLFVREWAEDVVQPLKEQLYMPRHYSSSVSKQLSWDSL